MDLKQINHKNLNCSNKIIQMCYFQDQVTQLHLSNLNFTGYHYSFYTVTFTLIIITFYIILG